MPDLIAALRDADMDHVRLVVGGIIPQNEQPELMDAGVSAIFGPGATSEEIVETVRQLAVEARAARETAEVA
jgi:methylmalonyl-CoA mutase C-terminal domain/subunit